jgi:hypothetical protein
MRRQVAIGLALAWAGCLLVQGIGLRSAVAADAPKKRPRPAEERAAGEKPAPQAPKAAQDAKKPAAPPANAGDKKAAETPSEPKPSLNAEMTALRDRVRRVLVHYFREPINTADNTPAEVLSFCLAFGCDTEVRFGSSAGNAMSGIGCLCYNYPCAEYRLLALDDKKAIARVGYALQAVPGELLAILALSAVPDSYEIRIGDWRGKVADLVTSEKLSCVSGTDLSQKLIGLTDYVADDASWKNAAGEAWSLERIVREELNRSPATYGPEVTRHLMGLAFAVERHCRHGHACDGQYGRAKKFLAEYEEYAFSLQNTDGSWHPDFFAAKGASRDASGVLRATGQILEWLVTLAPTERLQDRQLVRPVALLTGLLEEPYSRLNFTATSTQEIDAVMHAVRALRIYDRRVFKPADNGKPDAGKPDAGKPDSDKPSVPDAETAARSRVAK